jgi:LysM repeat protein
MASRSRARYLAPVALIATIAGVFLVVRHDTASHATTTQTHQAEAHRPPVGALRGFAAAKIYVVQPGDTLSRIGTKTGVSLSTLESLNPKLVDPNSLQAGQRLRLRQ